MPLRKRHILATALFATAWITTIAFGFRTLFRYENTPGGVGAVAQSWPTGQIERAQDRPTLVMVAHPRCPCTAASIGELTQIMAQLQGKIAAYLLFVRPTGADLGWEATKLWNRAETIPGLKLVCDAGGTAARRFGAETSGHTFLFGADGRLLFNGGITASRGHSGENIGESAIVALCRNEAPKRTETVIFGCSLTSPAETEATKLCLK